MKRVRIELEVEVPDDVMRVQAQPRAEFVCWRHDGKHWRESFPECTITNWRETLTEVRKQ